MAMDGESNANEKVQLGRKAVAGVGRRGARGGGGEGGGGDGQSKG